MAIVKFGALVTDMRGKLGGHVFQGSGLTTNLRTHVMSRGGIKFRDPLYNDMNQNIDALWFALSDSVKASWNDLAMNHPYFDAFGNEVTTTGQNFHRRLYTNFFSSQKTGTIDPTAAIGDLPSSELAHVEFSFSNQTIDVGLVHDRFSTGMVVYARPVLKFGLSIQAAKIPFIYGIDDEEPQDDELWDAFFAKYPNFQEGDPCWFGIKQVNDYGFATFMKTIYATFV